MADLAAAPSFSEWVLDRLRADGFRPRAWVGMLAASWEHARVTAQEHPSLTRSWQRLTLGIGALTVGALAQTAWRHGSRAACRIAVPLTLASTAQATDIYAHLGLHRRMGPRPSHHFPQLGVANALTALRGWLASWLWARLLAGVPVADDELALALTAITATDIADGLVARALRMTSPLGRYLDGEADVFVWTALTLHQAQRKQIPGWLVATFGLRWGLPIALGFARTFASAEPIALQPSPMGRFSGALQTAAQVAGLLGSIRANHPDTRIWNQTRDGVAGLAAGFLGAAMIEQVTRLTQPLAEEKDYE